MLFWECLSSSRYNHYWFKDTSELPKWRREKIALSWSDTCLTPITARVHITSAFTDGSPFPYIWVWEIDLKTCTNWKISIPLSAHNLWAEILKYLQQLPICRNASNLCINLHFSKAEPEVIGEEASAQLMHHPQAAFRKSFLKCRFTHCCYHLSFSWASPFKPFCLLAIFHFKDPQTTGLPKKMLC